MSDLIDGVLPSHRVHLLGGISDAGKTRWVLPAIVEWAQGNPVFNCKSNPAPWAYVAADRTIREAQETIASLNLNPQDVRIIPAFGMHNRNATQILAAAMKLDPQPQLLVWESFQDMCGEQKSEIKEFLGQVCAYCEQAREFPAGLTVLGVVESPKQKPYERYANPRQRISGRSAWSYHTSTNILIEAVKGDEEMLTGERTVWVCVKGKPRKKLQGIFDSVGRLLVP